MTAELTGSDANFGEASVGGLGPDRPDAYRDSVENDDTGLRLEADPAHAEDISPDQIERRQGVEETDEEELEITARPRDDSEAEEQLRDLNPSSGP